MKQQPRFEDWLNRRRGGSDWLGNARIWYIHGVLISHWQRTELVKIYHFGGSQTETYPVNSEQCREAVMELEDRP